MEIREIEYWAETCCGRITKEDNVVFRGDEDLFAETVDFGLCVWIDTLLTAHNMNTEGNYGWKYPTSE